MDFGAALIALFIALVVKGAVMIFGARLLFRLYRAAYAPPSKRLWLLLPPEDLPDVKVLWWSLVLFYVAELTCGVEVYIILRSSPLFTSAHAVASALGMGLFGLGLYGFADRHFFRYGGKTCLANRICRGCTYGTGEGCKFRLVLLLLGTFVAMASLAPFFAPTDRIVATTAKYALPFPSLNAWYDGTVVPWLRAHVAGYEPNGVAYFIPVCELVITWRIFPALSLALAVVALHLTRSGREAAGNKILAFSTGMICYSFFELILYRVTQDVLIGSLGHEIVEFWFILFTQELLQRTFGARSGSASGPNLVDSGLPMARSPFQNDEAIA